MAVADLQDLVRRSKAEAIRDRVLQRVLATLHVEVEERIFRQGKAASGNQIGTYSDEYRKTRRRKGYPPSVKVILQATNDMVNDFKLLVLPGKKYGSGFSRTINTKKSYWVESTYKKDIFELTKQEDQKLEELLEKELDKWLK